MRKIDVPNVRVEADPGPAPMLQWIEIKDLVVDDSYQRDLGPRNWSAIRKIAESFRWSRFSPVFCAPVEGGGFAIIDGQHRTHAAAMCGFKAVPCQVVQMSSSEQANAFSAVNGAVTAVTIFNLFRSQLASGDADAVAMVAMAQAAGCKVATSNATQRSKTVGTIFFIQGLKELHAKHGDTLRVALALLRNAEVWREDAALWAANVLFPCLQALCERPKTLADPRFPPILDAFDVHGEHERLADIRRRRLRSNLVAATTREALRQALIDHMDTKLPEKVEPPERTVA